MKGTWMLLTVMYQVLKKSTLEAIHQEEGGVAEKVVIVAIFVALAIAAGTIITQKVIDKANSINLG